MKKKGILMTLVLLLSFLANINVYAGNDKPITVEQLPQKAQEFLNTHFKGIKISFAKVDNELFDKSYEVFFVNGGKVEFDGRGNWKEIECKYGKVPVSAIPKPIANFIREKHPENYVIEIDRDRKDYGVKLNNEMEIKFDRRFNVIEYD